MPPLNPSNIAPDITPSIPPADNPSGSPAETLREHVPIGTEAPLPAADDPAVQATIDWLSFHRLWGVLPDETLHALARSLRSLPVAAGTHLYQAGQTPLGLYLLKWGSVEIYRQSPVGKTHILYRNTGDLCGYMPLFAEQAEPNEAGYEASAIALTASEVWFLDRRDFEHLIETHPDIQTPINHLLTQDLYHFAQRLTHEQARIQGLQSYIQPVPSPDAFIGKSKPSQKLAQQIAAAAADLAPVILQAAPGTGKTFVAGLIHQRSGVKEHPFVEVNCAALPRNALGQVQTDCLFGNPATGELGVIDLLERGTLLIDNAHLLSADDRNRLSHYLKTSTLMPSALTPLPSGAGNLLTTPATAGTGASENPTITTWVRVVLASPQPLDLPDIQCHHLKLFSLSQRKRDIPDFAQAFLAQFCRALGHQPLHLDPADMRRLISYDYPGNLGELAAILRRAVMMTPPEQTIVPESVLWSVQSPKNAFRVDLLTQVPWLRRWLLSRWWPEGIWWLVMALFIPVTVLGFAGPQSRESSLTLNLFWAWWWPFYLFLFAFVGRLWCAVCPFMITGEWLRTLSLWIWPRQLRPWPTRWLNRWGGWVLFAGFGVIYLWEQLWDLPHTPYLSSWLLLSITAGAVIFSQIYERRLWCRYLCPIGGMNGLFAKLSMVELRSLQQVCGSQCQTFGCYRGSGATPVSFVDALATEGQATDGCPLYSHPAHLADNRDCVLCMTCLKACPHRSVQLNLRFPATDLLEGHQVSGAEAALLLLLLGGVLMHHTPQILAWFDLAFLAIDADHLLTSLPVVLILLCIPALLIYGVHQLTRGYNRIAFRHENRPLPDYTTIVYTYLPLTLAANLAHYTPVAMTEAGQILPVIARTFGFSGAGWPTLTWSLDVAQFLQGVTLLSALAFSVYPLQRITQRSFGSYWPHLALMLVLTIAFFKLMM